MQRMVRKTNQTKLVMFWRCLITQSLVERFEGTTEFFILYRQGILS